MTNKQSILFGVVIPNVLVAVILFCVLTIPTSVSAWNINKTLNQESRIVAIESSRYTSAMAKDTELRTAQDIKDIYKEIAQIKERIASMPDNTPMLSQRLDRLEAQIESLRAEIRELK